MKSIIKHSDLVDGLEIEILEKQAKENMTTRMEKREAKRLRFFKKEVQSRMEKYHPIRSLFSM